MKEKRKKEVDGKLEEEQTKEKNRKKERIEMNTKLGTLNRKRRRKNISERE